MNPIFRTIILIIISTTFSCSSENDESNVLIPKNPDLAEIVSIDRFGEFGTLFNRELDTTLPGIDEPINFDKKPFIGQGFGPDGEIAKYYNFDVQPKVAAPLYLLYRESEQNPVEDQLPIFDVIPGDLYYNDFWRIYKVTVTENYAANSITSYKQISDGEYEIDITNDIVNCPVVPKGSSATLMYNDNSNNTIQRAWYKDKIVYYFTFEEKEILVDNTGNIPTSKIYVTFNINPEESNPLSGPASGTPTEVGTDQSHSVLETIPTSVNYSPFWQIVVYDNADFDNVIDLESAENANILNENAMLVNCPVVSVN